MTPKQREIQRKRRVIEYAEQIGNIPPVELDRLYYEGQNVPTIGVGLN